MAMARLVTLCFILLSLTACYKVVVPTYPSAITYPQKEVYIVRRGDTLFGIGKRYGLDYHILARRNHIHYPYTIYVGQRIYLNRVAPQPTYLPVTKTTKRPSVKPSPRAAYRKRSRGKARYSRTSLDWPVNGIVTSNFGKRYRRMHDGIDISAKEGTPVRAAAAGDVVYSGQRISGYGKLIIIRHSHDMFTAYAHNKRNLVRKGDRVKAGETIAYVGRSGRASAPHLHFEIRRGKTPVDPLAYLPRKRKRH